MKKIIAYVALLAVSAGAYADGDKFSHNAEFRVRYQYDQNKSGRKDDSATTTVDESKPTSQDAIEHRFKFGTTFKASENFSATLTLLHNAGWGSNDLNQTNGTNGASSTGDSQAVLNGINDAENMVLVNEAYGTWVVNDEFNVKFGRGSFGLADGNLVGENDYQKTPYSFEGVGGTYETEPVTVMFWGIRFAEYTDNSQVSNQDQDAETNSFGAAVDIKNLPEVFNLANIHAMHIDSDQVFDNTGALKQAGQSILRYGLALGGETHNLDFKVNYEVEDGELQHSAFTNGKRDKSSNMMQVELGYSLPEVMNSRFYVLYHQDSGDGNAADNKNETYDPYFYEMHYNAGLMDVVKWGNLTYISAGYTLEPMEDLMVGIHYHMFSKTEKIDAITAGKNGSAINGTDDHTKDGIGDELDLVATKKYDGGFSMTARAGMFMPGDSLEKGTTKVEETYTQVFLQGKMTF